MKSLTEMQMQSASKVRDNTSREDAAEQRYLAFSLNQEEYAVPLLDVREVIAMPEITKVPYTLSHFLGITNLRGTLISVIDLRIKLQMRKAEISPETAIVILDLSPFSLGVVVDSVNSVLSLTTDQISPPPDVDAEASSDPVAGVARLDHKLVLILDIKKVLNPQDLSALSRPAIQSVQNKVA